jgi:hypothetical protein
MKIIKTEDTWCYPPQTDEDALAVKNNWISVKDRLPFQEEKYKDWPGVCDQFLVTVYPKTPDPNDDPETMLLWFDNKNNYFSYEIGGKNYDEENKDWCVIAWMPKPKPAPPEEG